MQTEIFRFNTGLSTTVKFKMYRSSQPDELGVVAKYVPAEV
jgi:hypothetical protein